MKQKIMQNRAKKRGCKRVCNSTRPVLRAERVDSEWRCPPDGLGLVLGCPNGPGGGGFVFFSSTGLPNGGRRGLLGTGLPNGLGGFRFFFSSTGLPNGSEGGSFFFFFWFKYWFSQRVCFFFFLVLTLSTGLGGFVFFKALVRPTGLVPGTQRHAHSAKGCDTCAARLPRCVVALQSQDTLVWRLLSFTGGTMLPPAPGAPRALEAVLLSSNL